MAVRVWLHASDEERLAKYALVTLEHYAGEGCDELVSGEIAQTGVFSHLKNGFVLGKVRFWEKEGDTHRVPFVRVDNHSAYPHGLALTPEDWITIRYHKKSRTIDQLTKLHRVQLFPAPDNDFVRRAFITYDADFKVCKPHEHSLHFLVYCDARHLYNGHVADRH